MTTHYNTQVPFQKVNWKMVERSCQFLATLSTYRISYTKYSNHKNIYIYIFFYYIQWIKTRQTAHLTCKKNYGLHVLSLMTSFYDILQKDSPPVKGN